MCKGRWWGEAPERPKTFSQRICVRRKPRVCKAYLRAEPFICRGLAQIGQITKTCDADNAFGWASYLMALQPRLGSDSVLPARGSQKLGLPCDLSQAIPEPTSAAPTARQALALPRWAPLLNATVYTTLSSEPDPKSSPPPKSSLPAGSLSAVRFGSKSIFWFWF